MDVKIRKVTKTDSKELYNLINDEDIIKQLSGYPFPCPLSKIEKEIVAGIKGWTTGKSYQFTILFENEIAGFIVLENPSADKRRYDIGFYLGKKFWGKGIATEAVKQACAFGFTKLSLYRIQADNDSDNPASGKVLEKAGFTLEGIRKKNQKKGDKFTDLHMWGLVE